MRHLGIIVQLCPAISSQLRHVSTMGKKLVKCQYLLHTSLQYRELRPTNVWDLFGAPQQISTGFASWLHYCIDIAQQRSPKLCTTFGHFLHWYIIYAFLGALAPSLNFASRKIQFTSNSFVLLNWQRYCTALQHWRQPQFVAWYKEWN